MTWNISAFLWISNCLGLELVIDPDGEATFNALSIKVEGKSLTFEKKAAGLTSLESVRTAFPDEPFSALIINGKGVLHKKIAKVSVLDEKIMGQILPNANLSDFYIQNFESGESSFVSLMRKSDADTWIARLRASGFKLLSLSFGPFSVQQVYMQLNLDQRETIFGGYRIQRDDDGCWLDWTVSSTGPATFPIKVEDELLDENILIAYGAAFQLLYFTKLNPVIAATGALEEARVTLSGNKKLQAAGLALLSIFFSLLLINFIVFSYYASQVDKISLISRNTIQERGQAQAKLNELSLDIALLDSIGYNGGLSEAQMTDQLAGNLPAGVSWRTFAISPPDEIRARNEKKLVFSDRHIHIQGECKEVGQVNTWIENARKIPWVRSIVMENYTINQESGKGEFIMLVRY